MDDRRVFLLFSALILGGYTVAYLAYQFWMRMPPLQGDVLGYYFYLPTFFIYKDPSGYETVRSLLNTQYGDFILSSHEFFAAGVKKWKFVGKVYTKYTYGVALLSSPFFFLALLVSALLSLPLDGYNPVFQFLVPFSGAFYGVLGMYLLYTYLKRRFNPSLALITALLVLLGTNLYFYLTVMSGMSHSFAFFLVAALLHVSDGFRERPGPKNALLAGVVLGLLIAVRPVHAIFSLLLVDFKRLKRLHLYIPHFAIVSAVVLLVFLPQMLYWKFITGKFLVNPYDYEGLKYLKNPYLFEVLLGVRKGWFFWTPLAAFGVLGLLMERKWVYLLIIALMTYIIASWSTPWYGDSYGHRGFIDAYPLVSFGLASFLSSLKGGLKRVVSAVILLLVVLNLFKMYQYSLKIIPLDGTDWKTYVETFFQVKPKR